MADPGEGPPPPPPPPIFFLDQTEARRAENIFFGDPHLLSKGLDNPPPPNNFISLETQHMSSLRF